MIKYLSVLFYDNDFGRPMVNALERLWRYVYENNAHCVGFLCVRTVPEMFCELHKQGILNKMIERLYNLEDQCSDVEILTRGLYQKIIEKKQIVIVKSSELTCEVTLCSARPTTWQNGESAWLNLLTGKAETI